MIPLALLLIQAAALPVAPRKVSVEPPLLSVVQPCTPQSSGEIVVCGRTDQPSPYRLPLPPAPPGQPDKVRFRLPGDIAGDVHLEQGRLGDPRIMLHLTKKF